MKSNICEIIQDIDAATKVWNGLPGQKTGALQFQQTILYVSGTHFLNPTFCLSFSSSQNGTSANSETQTPPKLIDHLLCWVFSVYNSSLVCFDRKRIVLSNRIAHCQSFLLRVQPINPALFYNLSKPAIYSTLSPNRFWGVCVYACVLPWLIQKTSIHPLFRVSSRICLPFFRWL